MNDSSLKNAKPLLKWAGGKTQLLKQLSLEIPHKYETYVEPFFGGGALFFFLQPSRAVISDSNPELINLYQQVAQNVEKVISNLKKFKNSEDLFLKIRSQNWQEMDPAKAAARTIFLNKTCFNGLYRVNKEGKFNVPFAHYKNPTICDEKTLRADSEALKNATIVCGDFSEVLKKYAKKGDFIFLDPPYFPVSEYSDFKRYTKEQFRESDQQRLANECARLHELGSFVIETNSNSQGTFDLYGKYETSLVRTKRFIACKASSRTGYDIIIKIPCQLDNAVYPPSEPQMKKFPATRYMGSKNKLLPYIWKAASSFNFISVLDAFAGSNVVGYMFKTHGKKIISNDYMFMSAVQAKALVENNSVQLSLEKAQKLAENPSDHGQGFVCKHFKGLYFSDEDNKIIDTINQNIKNLEDPYEKAIAKAALIRACVKKRPRGIFTYVGHRYDDGRKDLRLSLLEQFLEAVKEINGAVFDNHQNNLSLRGDALTVSVNPAPDLVYIDPPYFSPLSDNEYVRRYHFVEGLARDWNGVKIQESTKTKKFKNYPTPFSKKDETYAAFHSLFNQYKDSILLVSYSSNSVPTLFEMVQILSQYKANVRVMPIPYRYSFGNQGDKVDDNRNVVTEYIFIGY